MSIAEKLLSIAENEQKVYDSGFGSGKESFGLYETVSGENRLFINNINNTPHIADVTLSSESVADLSTVTLKRHGKNFFSMEAFKNNYKLIDSDRLSFSEDSVTYRTLAGDSYCGITCLEPIYANGTVTFFHKRVVNGNTSTSGMTVFYFYDADGNNISGNSDMPSNLGNYGSGTNLGKRTGSLTITMDIPKSVAYFTVRFIQDKATVTISDIQIEKSTVATEFEAYYEDSYECNANGKIEGVKVKGPSNTIFADQVGVNITCGYYKDAEKEIEDLTDLIISLGGTV